MLFGVLSALVVALLITGEHLRHKLAVVDSCINNGCGNFSYRFTFRDYLGPDIGHGAVYALPALTGIFWGAPLIARELSTGTARTAWTQSITRTRWLTTKLTVTGIASIAATALLSVSATWWFSPFTDSPDNSRFNPATFDVHGLVPIGYAAFAFTLGVLAGMAWRRTIPAMVTTLLTFITTRIAVTAWIRPDFQTPRTLIESVNSLNSGSSSISDYDGNVIYGGDVIYGGPRLTPHVNDWLLSQKVIEPSGHAFSLAKTYCNGGADGSPPSAHCLAKSQAYVDKLRVVIKYQPANRYWPFQLYESLLYCGLAALLIGAIFWLLRRRSA